MTPSPSTYTHYSNSDALQLEWNRPQAVGLKPRGLWFSVNNSWEEWCEDNMPDWVLCKIEYAVFIPESANLLRIGYPGAMNAQYRGADYVDSIDWPAIAKVFDGIIVENYYRGFADMSVPMWWYSLDCSSGCIWNDCGVEISKIKQTQMAGQRG